MRHVPHCYVPAPWSGDVLTIPAATSRHLEKVLRLHPGDAVTYTDGAGRFGEGAWGDTGIVRGDERSMPAPGSITIAVAPPKGNDRQRFLVEKLAEIGVDRLVWLSTRYGDAHPPKAGKSEAWAIGALEQSRGTRKLTIEGPVKPEELPGGFVLAAPGGRPLRRTTGPLTIAIGPAGGWHPDEVALATAAVGLGGSILRTETAAVVAATLATACDPERSDSD